MTKETKVLRVIRVKQYVETKETEVIRVKEVLVVNLIHRMEQ